MIYESIAIPFLCSSLSGRVEILSKLGTFLDLTLFISLATSKRRVRRGGGSRRMSAEFFFTVR